MTVIWSNTAVGHLEQILDFQQGVISGGSITARRRILEAVRRVGQMPKSGRVGRIDGTREVVVPRSPFIVVNQLSEGAVKILGIWHAARLWPEPF
jgi:toxin ParE1/3/4